MTRGSSIVSITLPYANKGYKARIGLASNFIFVLHEKSYKEISKEQVQKRMGSTGDALIKAAENQIQMLNRDRFKDSTKARDIIAKPYLAKLLLEERLNEIQIIDNPEWDARLPIEIELKKAFSLIPTHR